MSIAFIVKKVPREKRLLSEHAFVYAASLLMVCDVLKAEFKLPDGVREEIKMHEYVEGILSLLSSGKGKNYMELSEDIVGRGEHMKTLRKWPFELLNGNVRPCGGGDGAGPGPGW